MPSRMFKFYFGSIGAPADEFIGSVGVAGFGRVEPLGCTPPSVGGVDGMLGAPEVGGFTEVSAEVEDPMLDDPINGDPVDDEPIEGSLIGLVPGATAEVSVDMPVAAVDEPAHQSLLARAFGEAFM